MAQYGLSGLTNYDLKMLFLIVWIITLELIKLEGYVMGNTGRKNTCRPLLYSFCRNPRGLQVF